MSDSQERQIQISLAEQRLWLLTRDRTLAEYRISTARRGAGERQGSECTPRGWHEVRAKIGAGEPQAAVFVGRRPTGERYHAALGHQHPDRDWILSRILWLSGLEPGRNRLGERDSMRRYIYIHGTPDTEPMGEPRSHGCVRMRSDEVIDLFEQVPLGTRVLIAEETLDPPRWQRPPR